MRCSRTELEFHLIHRGTMRESGSRVVAAGSRLAAQIEEELRRAFEPFTQQDESITRQKQGIGLGLFAARKTIELMGGSIELKPDAEGTVAILTIPQRRGGVRSSWQANRASEDA